MKVLVLKEFRYAANGIHNTVLAEGTEVEIHDAAVEGLEKEGFIVVGLPDTRGAGRAGGNGAVEAVAYDKMNKQDLIDLGTKRGFDVSKAKPKDIIAILLHDDEVQAAIAAGQFDALDDAELQKVAIDRQIVIPVDAKREDVIALLVAPPAS